MEVNMNDRIREAIAVARTGETQEAQLLVAAILENSPDNAQAWYLMSHLVDSPARRAAYLFKTVSLDPSHERARAELAQFPQSVTHVLSNSLSTAAPIDDDLSIAADSFSQDGASLSETPGESEVAEGTLNGGVAADGAVSDVPEWIRPLAGETLQRQPVAAEAEAAAVAEAAESKAPAPTLAKPKTKEAKPRKKRDGLLTAVVIFLVLITVVVLGLIAYLLLMVL